MLYSCQPYQAAPTTMDMVMPPSWTLRPEQHQQSIRCQSIVIAGVALDHGLPVVTQPHCHPSKTSDEALHCQRELFGSRRMTMVCMHQCICAGCLTVVQEAFDHGVPVVRRLRAVPVHRCAAALERGNLSDVPLLLKKIVGLCQALQPAW